METVIGAIIILLAAGAMLLFGYLWAYDRGALSASDVMNSLQSDLMEKLSLKGQSIKVLETMLGEAQKEIEDLKKIKQDLTGSLSNEIFFANEFKRMHEGVVQRFEEYKKEQESKGCSHVSSEYDTLVNELEPEIDKIVKKKKTKNAKSTKRKK